MVKMPHWPKHFFYQKLEFGFSRFKPMMEKLGNPHLKINNIIHVAGTNGKGSTVSFIRTILETYGYKVHTYTSPHLLNFNERILLYGNEITDEYLFDVNERSRLAEEELGIKVTFFEAGTSAAFLAFSENPADFIILEAGMGGTLDPTNFAPNKIATVITPISYDHTEYLGNTLPEIAKAKAGIMKEGVPSIISLQTDESFDALEQHAANLGLKTYSFGYDFGLKEKEGGYIYMGQKLTLDLPQLSLVGDHQFINAATALATIEQINIDLKPEKVRKALENTKWAGRLQRIFYGKLFSLIPNHFEIWLDGAHNASGGQIIGVWAEQQPEDIYIILGMTKNRDVKEFLRYIAPTTKMLAGVYVYEEPSSYKAEVVASLAKELIPNSIGVDSLEEAIVNIVKFHNSDRPAKIIVCGSLYLVAQFLRENK